MKTKITLLAMLITLISFAQNGINYKAVIEDNLGNVVANQPVTVQFTILRGGTEVYKENNAPNSDANGIIILNIGEGVPAVGSAAFSDINWSNGEHYLNVKIDTGSGLTNMGTTRFKTVPYAISAINASFAANVSGLEAINENFLIGWRLKGRDPAYYGNIGFNAVDLSTSNAPSSTKGATGNYSFATGFGTTSFGQYSVAMGRTTVASSTASTAMGWNTEATGDYSTAMGFETEASRYGATAMGSMSRALGKNSTAMGEATIAASYRSTTIGSYNTGLGTNATSWLATDPLFEIGNGVDLISRSNALTVLKNGNVGIGNHTPSSILEITHLNSLPTISNFRNALSIKNANSNESWQFHVDNGGTLLLYRKGAYRGYFDSSTGAYVQASDMRLKKDIIPLETNTLQNVMQLNPVSYRMIDQNDDERQIGLISQEVQQVFPSLTHLVPEQDILAISYTELIPVLIKALQEQQDIIKNQALKIDGLTAENEQKEETLKIFDTRLKQIENLLKLTIQ